MSSTLRKAISFGASGTIFPSPGNPQSVHYQDPPTNYVNLNYIVQSGTRWVKIWVDPAALWPDIGLQTATRDELDYQIALAKVYGCGIILTINSSYPPWINGTPGGSNVVPADVSMSSAWAYFVAALASRYSLSNPNRPHSGWSYIDILEIANEPNQSLIPRIGEDNIAEKVADMFKTAKQIVATLGNSPMVGGPGTGDIDPVHAGTIGKDYFTFTTDVMSRLNSNGFFSVGTDTACVWTQHNYADVTYDHGDGTQAIDRTWYLSGQPMYDRYHLRSLITTTRIGYLGWKGWPNGDPANPKVLLTEGGAERQSTITAWQISPAAFEDYQAFLTTRNPQRLSTDVQGWGIEMMTTYLLITDAGFDSGLVRADAPTYTPRSVYTNLWQTYPGRL